MSFKSIFSGSKTPESPNSGYASGIGAPPPVPNTGMMSGIGMQASIYDHNRLTTRSGYDINDDHARRMMVWMRMRLPDFEMPFQHLSTANTGDKVFVFVVQGNVPVTLEDDAAMFPSDQLITQLRLLQK